MTGGSNSHYTIETMDVSGIEPEVSPRKGNRLPLPHTSNALKGNRTLAYGLEDRRSTTKL